MAQWREGEGSLEIVGTHNQSSHGSLQRCNSSRLCQRIFNKLVNSRPMTRLQNKFAAILCDEDYEGDCVDNPGGGAAADDDSETDDDGGDAFRNRR